MILLHALFGFLVSFALSFAVLRLFPKWGLMDRPEKYGHKRAPIPLPGGIAPVLALLFGILLFFPGEMKFLGLFGALGLIAALSFWDDRKPLPALLRLAVHLIAAFALAAVGIRIEYLGNPLGETIVLGSAFSYLITIIWIVGFANVMNWLDGVPALSSLSASLAGIFLGLLSLTALVNQWEIAALCFLFSGATTAFLFFNAPPPKMLLGDTGSMTFGFFLAAMTVFSGGKMATALIVLLLPMLDAAFVILRRLWSKQSPWKGNDGRHLHDRLLQLGWEEWHILILFGVSSFLLGWASLQLATLGKVILLVCISLIFFVLSYFLDKILDKK